MITGHRQPRYLLFLRLLDGHTLTVNVVPNYYTGEIDALGDIAYTLRSQEKDVGYDSRIHFFMIICAGKRLNREEYNQYVTSGKYAKENNSGHVIYKEAVAHVKVNNDVHKIPIKRSSNGKWSLLSSISLYVTSIGFSPQFKLYTQDQLEVTENYLSDYEIGNYCASSSPLEVVGYDEDVNF